MPTVFSHSLVGVVFGKYFAKRTGLKFWTLTILCAIFPDFDVITRIFGIPLWHILGHRGVFHSVAFVIIVAFVFVTAGYREIKRFSKEWCSFFVYFLLIGLSHIILDTLTSGGMGVGLLMPFDSTRYLSPYKPIRISPSRLMNYFESTGARIAVSELIWVWIPSVAALIILWFFRRHKRKNVSVINKQ